MLRLPRQLRAQPARARKGVQVKVQIQNNFFMMRTRTLPAAAVRAFGTDGKRLPAAELRRLLRKEVTVLVSADGRKVDPFYLEVFRADTPVLVLPSPVQGAVIETARRVCSSIGNCSGGSCRSRCS